MKIVSYLLLIAFALIGIHGLFAFSTQAGADSLPATALKPCGRHVFTDNQQLELIGSAAHVGFSFKGKSCQVYAHTSYENGHNYLQYELDGVYQKRIKVSGDTSQAITLTAAGEGVHKVWLYKTTEAHAGPVFLEKITGKSLYALERPKAPYIEFIGNSITCGADADDSEVPCGQGVYHDYQNGYDAYGPRVARALKMNYILSSVSGIGVYRNWNSDGPTLPQVYEKADLQESGTRMWDFSSYSPAIVSIALGTNDLSGGDGVRPRLPFDPEAFTAAYVQFVKQVKGHYPDTQIALLSSPMVYGEWKEKLEPCLLAVKAAIDAQFPGDKPVAVLMVRPMEPKGCMGHPSVAQHGLLAEELLPFFKGLK